MMGGEYNEANAWLHNSDSSGIDVGKLRRRRRWTASGYR